MTTVRTDFALNDHYRSRYARLIMEQEEDLRDLFEVRELRNVGSIQRRFLAFHAEHPEVYDELVELCRQWKRLGNRKASFEMFWQVLRWNRGFRR